jgi:hypothetical protein
MKIAFHKANDYWEKLVALFTMGPYAHVEFLFSDNQCCGATPVKSQGVRYSPSSIVLQDLSQWTLVDLPLKVEQEFVLRAWCDGEIGCLYDWNDIFRFIFNIFPPNPNDWFCSEFCLAGLQHLGLFPGLKACNYSPNRLYRLLECDKVKTESVLKYINNKGNIIWGQPN